MIIAVPSFIISGQTWPLTQMPSIIQWVAQFIPLTHYLEAFRKLMMYQTDLKGIWPQLKSLLYLSLINVGIAYVALRYRISKQKQ
jgi:ABC-2 type transport system permease protein